MHSLEQHVEEVQQDQQRWLTSAKEKVTWCSEVSGDKYSIEAKLATVQVSIAIVCIINTFLKLRAISLNIEHCKGGVAQISQPSHQTHTGPPTPPLKGQRT